MLYKLWTRLWAFIRNFLQSITWRDFIYIAIIFILLILFIKGCHRKDPNVQIVQPTLKPAVQKTDKQGTVYTEIKGTLYTEAQVKALSDSFRKVLKVSKVQGVIRTVTNIDTSFKHDTLLVDPSTGYIYVADSNKNLKISYTGNYKRDTGSFHLKFVPDTATYVPAITKHLFRSDDLTLSIYHTNELFKSSAGYFYTAKQQKVIAAIGPLVAVGYSTSGKPGGLIGAGIVLNLWGLKTGK